MTTVREIMQEKVVTVEPETTMLELSRILAEARIGGAPVIDRAGSLVGVISGTDVLRLASGDAEAAEDLYPFDPVSALDPHASAAGERAWFYLSAERPGTAARVDPGEILGGSLLEHTVGEVMSGERHAVSPDMSVEGLARFLLERRIHRALVTDAGRLLGIVTTYDVLRAVASGTGAETAA